MFEQRFRPAIKGKTLHELPLSPTLSPSGGEGEDLGHVGLPTYFVCFFCNNHTEDTCQVIQSIPTYTN